MKKQYSSYYTEMARRGQLGHGISGFHGVSRYQRGHGFFGNLFRHAIVPALKFLGKQAATTGANIASDVLLNKRDFKEAAREHLEEGGREIANAGIQRARKYVMEGKGRRRKPLKRLKQGRDLLKYL